MIRHVVVISDLSVERDGATAVAMTAVRFLRERGVTVTYFCGDTGENAEFQALGVRVVPVNGQEIRKANPFSAAFLGLYNVTAANALRDLINEIDGEGVVYHLHNWSKILSPSIFGILKGVSDRLVISAHDYFLACPNGGYFNFKTKTVCDLVPLTAACLRSNCDRRSYLEKIWRITRRLIRSRLIDLSRKTATILAVHDGMVDHLVRGGISANSIEVLRNPVTPWSERRIAAEKNHRFLFVGRLDHDKGAGLLAKSARGAGVTLQMVGDGPLRPFLEQNFPEVELLGWQSREDVAQIAQGARVVVMPTGSRETFGLVAFEALTSGIPVIISTFAATCDEIVRNNIGLSCNPYDAKALADVLRSMATDDHRVRGMSERAWRMRNSLALSNQGWGDHLLSFYENAARRDAEIGNLVGTYGA